MRMLAASNTWKADSVRCCRQLDVVRDDRETGIIARASTAEA